MFFVIVIKIVHLFALCTVFMMALDGKYVLHAVLGQVSTRVLEMDIGSLNHECTDRRIREY